LLDTVRVSQSAKEQLIRLKSRTGITQWNVLCRWAICKSLGDADPPAVVPISTDSNVEMTWRTFGGEFADLYLTLVELRCHQDGLGTDEGTVAEQFKLHLHRGIGYLFGDRSIMDIAGLMNLVPESE
jgi:DNA sulfur modification protein DndE